MIRREQTIKFKTNTGETFDAAFTVDDGKTDFELWLEIPGNENKTKEDYAKFKTGEAGAVITSAEVTEKIIEV